VILVGNVASDPDVRASQGGTYITKVRIATNVYAGKSEDGTVKAAHRLPQPGVLRQACRDGWRAPPQGSAALCGGAAAQQLWDDAASGQKRYKTEVVVDGFRFLGPKQQSQEAAA